MWPYVAYVWIADSLHFTAFVAGLETATSTTQDNENESAV
jgi:hypothetical protein